MNLLKYPDPRLKIICEPVPISTLPERDDMRRVLDRMWEIMEDLNGMGLAAPQIGIPVRMIVVHCPNSMKIEMINPHITFNKRKGRFMSHEGCLSWPGERIHVRRWRQVQVEGLDRDFRQVKIGGKMLQAAALQHEMEHLDGINLADHAGKDWETI